MGSHGDISSELRLPIQDLLYAVLIHDHQHQISCGGTELHANTGLIELAHNWRAPATILVPVEKGQAGGGVELLTRTTPMPLEKMPTTQVVPQALKAKTRQDHGRAQEYIEDIIRMASHGFSDAGNRPQER